MRLWEGHWTLPDVSTMQQMLARCPDFTEARFRAVLQCLGCPPGLIDNMVVLAHPPLESLTLRRLHAQGVISGDQVFLGFLHQGLSPTDAASMTAYVLVYDTKTKWDSTLGEIIKSYTQGLTSLDDATTHYTRLITSDFDTMFSRSLSDNLTDAQAAAAWDCLASVGDALSSYAEQELTAAWYTRQYNMQNEYAASAKSLFTSWRWDEMQTRLYLTNHGFAADRTDALIDEWQPTRDKQEKLPSVTQLDDFLHANAITPDQWYTMMKEQGYNDVEINALLQTSSTLPSAAMLERFRKGAVITDDQYRKGMAALGYSAGDVQRNLELIWQALGITVISGGTA
jgi:DNA-binding transcriptional regulator YhcF (GntR family)